MSYPTPDLREENERYKRALHKIADKTRLRQYLSSASAERESPREMVGPGTAAVREELQNS